MVENSRETRESRRTAARWTRAVAGGPAWGSYISDRLRVEALLPWAGTLRGRLLDLGCGGCPYEAMLGANVSAWIGIDQPMPAAGRSRAHVLADLRAPLPFRDASFDAVLSTQVLEHVPEPEALLHEVARVLKPGGRLLLTAPQTNPVHEAPHDYYRYTQYGLRHLIGKAGLNAIDIQPMGGALAAVGQQIAWHLSPATRVPRVGPWIYASLVAPLQLAALAGDAAARRHGDGAVETTMGYCAVAERPAPDSRMTLGAPA